MLIFSLDGACEFSKALSAELSEPISTHEERLFPDGERKVRPLVDPRGADVYVVHGLHGGPLDSPHDKLCRLLMFVATLHEHGASRVTAVVPYLAYARKDRQTKPYDPLGLRYVAQMFESVGLDQLITLEVHNIAAFQNAFRCTTQHLQVHRAFQSMVQEHATSSGVAVASPDPGGVKRAQIWREELEVKLGHAVGFAMVDKRRSAGVLSGSGLVCGDVEGSTVFLLDDLIASGETMQRAAVALRCSGASRVVACAAHGLFIDPASAVLQDDSIHQLVVSDSIPAFRVAQSSPLRQKMRVVSAVSLFAQAISHSHGAWRH